MSLPRRAILPLPYARPPLSMNDSIGSRAALFAVAAKKREIRTAVAELAEQAHLPRGVDHATVQLHYRPAERRRRDTDNLNATLKPACDGLAAGKPAWVAKSGRKMRAQPGYGLVPDDTPRWMSKPEPIIHDPQPGRLGALWLEITWSANQ
ncbi:hypothetical protein [Nocardia salmonicida]|uniref:hypothetical protein n=1 Tax=Nocardia salmonicida TaxID=53431 RepID=UPI0036308398